MVPPDGRIVKPEVIKLSDPTTSLQHIQRREEHVNTREMQSTKSKLWEMTEQMIVGVRIGGGTFGLKEI